MPGSTSTFSAPSSPGTPSPSLGTPNSQVGTSRPTDMPSATGTVAVNEPMVVKAGQTFDGGGKLLSGRHSVGRRRPKQRSEALPLEVSITNSCLTNGDEVFRTDAANARATLDNSEMNNINYDARGPSGHGSY